MKNLYKILNGVKIINLINDENKNIKSLQVHSDRVSDNDLYFAIKGSKFDGYQFIEKAIKKGAKVIVCNKLPDITYKKVTYIKVTNVSYSLGIIAKNFYNNPSINFKVIVITGTNGKTTCATLLYQLFTKLGYNCSLISTIENYINNKKYIAKYTTPDILYLNKFFVKVKKEKCTHLFMEASSHAIHQNRLVGITIDIAIFTNITHEHLDYHKNFKEYLKAKKKLFDNLDKQAIAISNIDDKNGKVILQNCLAKKKFYSLKMLTNYKGKIIDSTINGLKLKFHGIEFSTPFIGTFNAYNLLLIFSTACELNIKPIKIIQKLSEIEKVKGRFEMVLSKERILLIIDYAHTPDAMSNILKSINEIRTHNETLFTIFGCGGDRDKEKRPKMGNISAKLSDKVIITSDNPRNEDPNNIINDIKSGIRNNDILKCIVVPKRKQAIKKAIFLAQKNDIILITGKGHEKYQEIKKNKYIFNDLEVVKKLLSHLKK